MLTDWQRNQADTIFAPVLHKEVRALTSVTCSEDEYLTKTLKMENRSKYLGKKIELTFLGLLGVEQHPT